MALEIDEIAKILESANTYISGFEDKVELGRILIKLESEAIVNKSTAAIINTVPMHNLGSRGHNTSVGIILEINNKKKIFLVDTGCTESVIHLDHFPNLDGVQQYDSVSISSSGLVSKDKVALLENVVVNNCLFGPPLVRNFQGLMTVLWD
jgi:hypothetical protein